MTRDILGAWAVCCAIALTTVTAMAVESALADPGPSSSGAGVVEADAMCKTDDRTGRAYAAGFRSGESLVKQSWASTNRDGGGCGSFQKLVSVVVDGLGRLFRMRESSDYVKCRYNGLVDGALHELESIVVGCGNPLDLRKMMEKSSSRIRKKFNNETSP
jgi:hypothetical protein